jgi:Trp operon repressor
MPHISSKKLNKKVYKSLATKLLRIFEKAEKNKVMGKFLQELLTRTEKIMLAKRLAIIFMLSAELPQEKIASVLKVSPTTISKASLKIEIGKYDTIIKISRKEKFDLEKLVWSILTIWGLMPPKVGRKYWRKKYNK